MIVFLYGQDSYRIKENLEKILEGYNKKNTSGVNVFSFDFNDGEQTKKLIQDIEEPIKTMSFFDEKKIVVIKNLFTSPVSEEIGAVLEHWKLDKDQNIIMVFVESLSGAGLAKKSKKLFALLEKKSQTVKEFEMLSGKKLENWVLAELENLETTIEPNALAKLLQFATANIPKEGDPNLTWQLKQEIDKLSAGATGNTIRLADIEGLVVPEIKDQVFSITDALAEKNKIKYFSLLYGALDRGMETGYIFSMIIYQFRNLLSVKSLAQPLQARAGQASSAIPFLEVIKKSGLHPYVARKTFEQARKFEFEELKQTFNKLAEIEITTKSGLSDMSDELYGLAFQ